MLHKSLLLLGLGAVLVSPPSAHGQKRPATKPAASTAASSGTRLVEKVTAKPGELVIPYEKYVLPNGLTLLVVEDHSDPIAHVDVTYHVGSARETIGKSGFAHFFEHMMFQGSDNVGDEQHFKIVSSAGGQLNGTTDRDRTNYFETLPNNQLETALWLEADRMGFLLDAVTQPKFEVQRSTVKNERGQGVDNYPYGRADEVLLQAMYPYGHSYSWPVIGYLEDLDRSDVNDLKNFFLRWYGPNNATLTVAGDVKPAEVVKLVEKYYGAIPRGPEVPRAKAVAPVLAQDRRTSYEDANISQPMLQLVFPGVPQFHPDEVPLDALADILGKGSNSLLYKNLIKTQKAAQAFAYNPCYELGGEFTMQVMNFAGADLDETETLVRKTLAEFEQRGVTDDDIARFKAHREAGEINSLSSVQGKATKLAAYHYLTGNANMLPKDIQRIRAVTKADVMRVYNQYIKGKKAVVLSVVPTGKGELAAGTANFKVDQTGFKAPKDEYAGLKYVKAKDSFDRSKQPGAGPNPVVKVPELWRADQPNGLRVMGARNTELPTTNLLLTIRGGHRLEQSTPQKAGLAEMTAKMLGESTEKYSSEEMDAALTELGSNVYIYAGDNDTKVYVQSLTKNLDKTLALVEQSLLHPRFSEEDFARVKKQQADMVADFVNQPNVVADLAYNRLMYGPNNIAGTAVAGTPATVANITLADIKQFYQQNYAPNISHLVVVSDAEQQTIAPKLAFLQQWSKKDVQIPADQPAPKTDKTKLYFVNKDGAPQSEIRVGYMAMPYDATGEFYRAGLANYLLGGAFNSRINLNLREDKGYTYGAWSYFRGSRYAAPFMAQAGVRADASAASVKEFMKEIENYRNGISDDELQFLKTSIGQSEALKYETGQQKASFLARLLEYDLKPDYVDQQAEILKQLKREDVQALAQKYMAPEKMSIVAVGDKKYLPEFQKLGYEVVEIDMEGNPVKPAVAATETPAAPALDAKKDKSKKKAKDDSQKKGKAPYRMNAG
ncbi:pitrilysin family protein [Hymenobacter koreensis]|uniref:Pitrilysin family protein n=1 Tax=Hymenobacter koreensis TaxID=1084523 RepID=A0ABP8JMK1_9BACT